MKRSDYLATCRKYPFYCGDCKQCGNQIMAKDAGMVKPNRKFCSKSCRTTFQNLNNNPIYHKGVVEKINNSKKNMDKKNYKWSKERRIKWAKKLEGSNSRFWKGGLTDENRKHRNSVQYQIWREAVFARDNWTCQECGARNGNGFTVKLNADHIKPWALYPELRFAIDNGRTLCLACHLQTDTFGHRALWNALERNDII